MKAKFVLGVFGVSGCGKSTLSRYLVKQYNFKLVDLDALGHCVLQQPQIIDKLTQCFGKHVLEKSGTHTVNIIDRVKLGKCVFSNSQNLNKLNYIVHPALVALAKEHVNQVLGPIVVDGALINDFGLDRVCDACVAVKASIANIMAFTQPKKVQILASQSHIFKQVEQAALSIENTYEPLAFYRKVDSLLLDLNIDL